MSDEPRLVALAEHPRAARGIRRAKSLGGLAGVVVAAAGAYLHGAAAFDVLVSALVGGVVAHYAAWGCAVAAWRHLVAAEARAVARRVQAEHAAAAAATAAASPEA